MPALKVTYHEINVNAHSWLWFMNLMKNVTVAYLETCETSMMAFFLQNSQRYDLLNVFAK